MEITIEELKRLKPIMDNLESISEMVGRAYYDTDWTSVYEIHEDGFDISISLPREGDEREFVSWDMFLSKDWQQTLVDKIEHREESRRIAAMKKQQSLDEKERAQYIKLKQKFEPEPTHPFVDLLKNQQPLGSEFSEVLSDNLCEMYVSTEDKQITKRKI